MSNIAPDNAGIAHLNAPISLARNTTRLARFTDKPLIRHRSFTLEIAPIEMRSQSARSRESPRAGSDQTIGGRSAVIDYLVDRGYLGLNVANGLHSLAGVEDILEEAQERRAV